MQRRRRLAKRGCLIGGGLIHPVLTSFTSYYDEHSLLYKWSDLLRRRRSTRTNDDDDDYYYCYYSYHVNGDGMMMVMMMLMILMMVMTMIMITMAVIMAINVIAGFCGSCSCRDFCVCLRSVDRVGQTEEVNIVGKRQQL